MAGRLDHTPDDPRIFVFGSNLRGIHGAGAARYARKFLGAQHGKGSGLSGRSYALATCSAPGVPLTLSEIAIEVGAFLNFARSALIMESPVRFYVSKVGCGLAGYREDQIAPLFKDSPENCDLPDGWR